MKTILQFTLIGFLSLLSISIKAQSGTLAFTTANRTNIGTTVSDGRIYSTDISGIQLDIFAAMNSAAATSRTASGSFVYFDSKVEGLTQSKNFIVPIDQLSGDASSADDSKLPRLVVIKSNDGSEFNFKSIYVSDMIGSNTPIKFEGFRNGTSTGNVVLDINQGTYEEIFTSTKLTPSIFQNVDEVRISNMIQGEFTWGIYAGFNDIVIDVPVVAAPVVSSVTVPANKTYKIADVLNFTVNFDQNVTVTGTPQLPITLNTGGTVNANYVSGSGTKNLVFSYTVASGNLDADGIAVSSALLLNGGTIKNASASSAVLTLNSVGATTSVLVDGVAPTTTITSTASAITNSTAIPVTVTFSEAVTGFISSDVTVSNGTLNTFAGSGTTYSFTVTPAAQGLVTVAIAGSVATDAAGNNNTAATALTRTFDNVNPTVVISTTASEPTNLAAIPVTVTFSEAVTGLELTDFTVVNATLSALTGSGTTYTLTATPTAQGTVSVSLGSGSVLDVAQLGNVASNQLSRTFDNIAPSFAGFGLVVLKSNFITGDILSFSLQMNENVTVTGSPYVVATIGSKLVNAVYASTSLKTIYFNYTVQASDYDNDGVNGTPSIILNGGTVKDAAGNSYITMPAPSLPFPGNNVNVVSTSVAAANEIANVSVYPNPALDVIHLSSTEGIQHISIINLAGSVVWSGSASQFPINVSSFAKGIYLLNMVSADGVKTEKVVIK